LPTEIDLTDDLVRSARKGKRSAVVAVLAIHYPIVWRMAAGLSGRNDVARGVVKFVMKRSLRNLRSWKDETAPTRWFAHHTLLTTRRAAKHQPALTDDTLLSKNDLPHIAFIRALRALPMQQREAFILSAGEKIDLRAIAVAMDCSTTAADNHLREAMYRLRELAGDRYEDFVAELRGVYLKLAPDDDLSVPAVRMRVERFVLPWHIWRIVKFLLALVLLGFTIFFAWWAWRILQNSM
jgi:DNA-directed RNA polymerase specialized sigma24 family protein